MVQIVEPARQVSSVRSVERALDLLSALEKAGRPIGVSELGRAATMPKATAQRILSVLERRGLVQRERGRYQLGVSVVPLARAFLSTDTVVSTARLVVEQLAVASGESASLYVREGYHRVILLRVESTQSLRIVERVGQRRPLHLGAASQVLLANMPQEEINRYLDGVGETCLASGVTLSRDEMLAKLERVRREGFAVSYEERIVGVIAVAAPVSKPGQGVVAAIGISGPLIRFTPERVQQLSIEVRRAAEEASQPFRYL